MLRKRLAALFTLLFIAGAFASTPVSPVSAQSNSSEKAEVSDAFSVLHAVVQWSNGVSETADKKAKSDLVKGYANSIRTANAQTDTKLQLIANKHAISVVALDPQTEAGKSLLDRMKGEAVLLGSLQGDAWDRDYMVLVTNTQQSVLHLLKATKALAKDPEVKQFISELSTTVQNRLKTAQDIMAKVYGDTV
jgi:predicted outer membrane protein